MVRGADMKKLTRIVTFLSQIFNILSYICFFGVMMFIVTDVMLRFLFSSPILGAYEIVEQLMLCGVFASFAYAQVKGAHIHVTMVIARLPKRAAITIFALGELLSAAFAGFLCISFIQQVQMAIAFNYRSVVLKFSTVPAYVVIAIAAGVFTLTLLLSALKSFIAIFSKKYAEEVMGAWS